MSYCPVILALDQSSSRTGWARGTPDGPVTLGSYCNPKCGQRYGRALNAYAEWIDGALDGVDIVAFEQPVRPGALHLHTGRLLYGIAGVIEMVAERKGIRAIEADNGEHKKLIYGKGGKKPEPYLARRHAARWGFEAANIDECDAAGVFLITIKYQFPDAFNAVWVNQRAAA